MVIAVTQCISTVPYCTVQLIERVETVANLALFASST